MESFKLQQQPPMKPCKHCRQMIDKKASVCPYCRKKQSSGCLTVFIVLLGIVFVFFAFVILFGGSGESNSSETNGMTNDEYKAICTSDYTYENVARSPDSYKGKDIIVHGEIIQVQESGSRVIMRVAEKDYDDIWYVTYKYSESENRLLEDDYITIYGECDGLETYQSLLGQSISIPSINARVIERTEEPEETE